MLGVVLEEAPLIDGRKLAARRSRPVFISDRRHASTVNQLDFITRATGKQDGDRLGRHSQFYARDFTLA